MVSTIEACEGLAPGQHEMDAHRTHTLDLTDGPRELALERAHLVDPLLEARGGEAVGAVEQLVADRPARRQAFGRKGEPHPGDLLDGDEDPPAIALEPVGHALTLEALHHRRAVARVEVSVEERHRRLAGADGEEHDQAEEPGGDDTERRNPRRPKRAQSLQQPVHVQPSPSARSPAERRPAARATVACEPLPSG